MSRRTVHPFPARMAPELIDEKLSSLDGTKTLCDPMMGSGSFVLSAAQRGHDVIGCDSDPLSHIVTTAAAGAYDKDAAIDIAHKITRRKLVDIDAITDDSATQDFIRFWFDEDAVRELATLATGVAEAPVELRAVLWCGFSRMIITKDAGASRARDVSHSRPHRVREKASFSAIARFARSVKTVVERSNPRPSGTLAAVRADSRSLPLPEASVDGIMTSPPYLIAIDYLRGHRLSLVWMGFDVGELRTLRGTNIGSERGANISPRLAHVLTESIQGDLSPRKLRIINRYVSDLDAMVAESARVLRPGGSVTFVVGNSTHGATTVSTERMVQGLADLHGLQMTGRSERQIPGGRRYLPPPKDGRRPMDQRMHTEVVATFNA